MMNRKPECLSGAKLDAAQVGSALRERLRSLKCPKDIVVTDSLPKTATGKVQKAKLWKTHVEHYAKGGAYAN
ncbi:MAG: hypothetical protein KIS83_14135 [Rubrivivax sp.]|nr:hypothetical protein [Rubrivivax sp.]